MHPKFAKLVEDGSTVYIFLQTAEVAFGGVLSKKVFLKISQILQENTCVRVSFNKVACREIYEIFKNSYFEENLQKAASVVLLKFTANPFGHSALLKASSFAFKLTNQPIPNNHHKVTLSFSYIMLPALR